MDDNGRLWIDYVPLDEVARWPRNPKDHDLEGLAASFERFGYRDPILKDETSGRLIAGHGRLETLESLRDAGEKPPPGIFVKGGAWTVPVVRGNHFGSESEAEAFLLAHNRLTEVGGWNQEELDAMLQDHAQSDLGFQGMGWDPETFLNDPGGPDIPGPDDPQGPQEPPGDPDPGDNPLDYVPEVVAPVAAPGDVWALGDHRVLCGDSTLRETTDKLLAGKKAAMVLTDPPFGIYGSSTGVGADITDDRMVQPFYRAVTAAVHRILPTWGHAYLHCDWRSWATLWVATREAGLTMKNMVVWDKGDNGLGTNFTMCHELIAFMMKLPPAKAMKNSTGGGNRAVRRPNIVRHGRLHGENRLHNAAKPVKVLVDFVTNSSEAQDIVVDLFLGSGSTLIAAEQAGRICYGVDIDPKWVDVTVARWEKLTGKKAKRLTGGGPKPRRRKRAQ